MLELQRAVGNRAVSRLIQRDVMTLSQFQKLAKPGSFASFFGDKEHRDVPELERLYAEYELVRGASDNERVVKLKALDDRAGSLLNNQKTPPDSKLQKALQQFRAQSTPELQALTGRIEAERERVAIDEAGIAGAILTPEIRRIPDPAARATALFEAFMKYGRAHFRYRTTGTKPLLEGGTTTLAEALRAVSRNCSRWRASPAPGPNRPPR
ncbi:MAG: hypothetical protein ACRDG3_12325 [Tepidiformaceae bacterium]